MKGKPIQLQIPEALREKFRVLERRLWWVDTVLALSGAAGSLCLSYLVLFTADRFGDTPPLGRLLLAGLGWGGVVWFLGSWARQWLFRRKDFLALSGLVQGHYPALGDRLLGIVELSQTNPGNFSPALCQAAIRQVAEEAAPMDFRRAVATRKSKVMTVLCMLLLGLALTPWILVPEAGWNTLTRWLKPGAAVARFTFVSLEDLPPRLVVAHGEPFEIVCGIRLHPFWSPSWAEARPSGQPTVRVPVWGGQVVFPINAQTAPIDLMLKIGDVTRRLSIEPLFRPALQSMEAQLQLPAYLQRSNLNLELPHGSLEFVEGAQVAFHGRTTREVVEAQARVTSAGAEDPAPDSLWSGEPVSEGFRMDWKTLPVGGEAVFTWRDEWGLTSAAPWHVRFTARSDEAPEASCPEQPALVAMLQEEILTIATTGRDDFGLRQTGLAWYCQKPSDTNLVASGWEEVGDGNPEQTRVAGDFRFSPQQLRIPADVLVTLHATAQDYFPGRPRSESGAYQIYVLSNEEHARLLQEEFEKIMEQLEDLTRRQQALQEAGREVQRLEESMLGQGEAERRLAEQANEQGQLASRLSRLAEQVAANLKEALRNRSIPTELLEQWARFAQAMKNLSQNEMAQAAQSLALAASSPSASSEGADPARQENLAEALELEEEALRRLLELQKEIGPALDDLLANTLAQRLRRIARQEAQIGGLLESVLPHTVGLAPEALPENYRHTLNGLGLDQARTRRDAAQLELEISRFFDRTGEEDYGTVARAMRESEASVELGRMAEMIQQNQSALAMKRAEHWEGQFNGWADLLEKLEEGSGGSSGAGAMSEEALRRLLALLRLRQHEQNLRDHTQLLEARRESHQGYREDAIILSIRQMYLKEDVEALQREGPGRFLPEVAQAMDEAESFLIRPRTDQPVIDVQTDAINLLEGEMTDMMNVSPGSSLAAAMAMMMEMMGMSPGGNAGGGNMAGGTTDQPNLKAEGDMRGSAGEGRATQKTTGTSARPVPVEYREALQQYHRGLEQLEANWRESQAP